MKTWSWNWMAFGLLCLGATTGLAQSPRAGLACELMGIITNANRTALVTGESEIRIQADRAIITVKVSTTAKELGAALRSNQEARAKLTRLLTEKGIEEIKQSKFSSTEKYGMFSDKVKSHRVSNLLKVTVRNEKEFQIVADAVDGLAEAQYLGAEFERSDKEEMKQKAIAAACDNATQRKLVFEQKLGLKLTVKRFFDPSVVMFPNDQTVSNRALGFAGVVAGLPAASSYSDAMVERMAEQREDDRSGFGELTFRSRVTVEYDVEAK